MQGIFVTTETTATTLICHISYKGTFYIVHEVALLINGCEMAACRNFERIVQPKHELVTLSFDTTQYRRMVRMEGQSR